MYIFLIGVIRVLYPEFSGFNIYAEVHSWSFFCIVSLIQVLLSRGSTLGHNACRLVLASDDGGSASPVQLVMRHLYLWLFTDLPLIVAGQLMNFRFAFIVDVIILALTAISRIYFVLYFINVILRRGKPMPHDKLSKTHYRAT